MTQAILTARTGNDLLDSLADTELQQLHEKLKRVFLQVNQVLSTQGESVEYLYFPTTGLVSCRATGQQGDTIEIYAVGHEGIVEPAAILTSVAAVTAEVQIAGEAYQVRADDLCKMIRETKELAQVLLKYSYSLAVRMVQATRCAMFHTVKQRLVLWLLLAQRAHGNDIPCTHQAIADSLGARRASVTLVLQELEQDGVIETRRGRVVIRNRAGLENASCDCFQLIKAGLQPNLECDLLSTRNGDQKETGA